MKLKNNILFNTKTLLTLAVEKGNYDIVKSLLDNPNTDVNSTTILNLLIFL